MMAIYCFDLDGTLCTHEPNYADAAPMPERIAMVNALFDAGHKILVETARGSETGICWREVTAGQLERWGCKYHVLRTGQKLYADHYVDDKAIKDTEFFECKSNDAVGSMDELTRW